MSKVALSRGVLRMSRVVHVYSLTEAFYSVSKVV